MNGSWKSSLSYFNSEINQFEIKMTNDRQPTNTLIINTVQFAGPVACVYEGAVEGCRVNSDFK